jgi:hypothetical protein
MGQDGSSRSRTRNGSLVATMQSAAMSEPIHRSGVGGRRVSLEPGSLLDVEARSTPTAHVEFREIFRVSGPVTPSEAGAPPTLREAALRIARCEQELDRVIRGALQGHTLSHEELIALQATVYRYSQEVELAAKLVDRLTGTVKQMLTSQQ